MTDAIYRYQVYCIEESAFVETLSETEPTECPNPINHTDRSINTSLTSVIETFHKNTVVAEEESDGYFETSHIKMDITAGTPGDVTEHDVSWVMKILLWRTYLTPTSDMIGDEITVMAAPETQVGVLTSPTLVGDTVLNVDSGIFSYIQRGFLITVDDGNDKDVLGRITAIDTVAETITVETATSYAFAAMTPVKISIYILENIYINDTNIIDIGGKGMKGKIVPAGTILRVYYTNNTGTSKTFRWRPEIYNMG